MARMYYGVALLVLAFLMLGVSATFAQAGASTTAGVASGRGDPAAGNANAEAGNVTEVNVTSIMNTYRWAGFWGVVTGQISLADASSNWFINWTVTDPTGSNVYTIANGQSPDWQSIGTAAEGDIATAYPWIATGNSDSWDMTFSGTGSITVAGNPVTTNRTTTLQYNASLTNFYTYVLYDSATHIWAAVVDNDEESYSNETADYQMLVPENGTSGNSGVTSYSFYLELL